MGLLELPHELIIQVAKFLEYDEDINSLSRTRRLLHMVLNDFLYQNHILNHGSSGLEWAASTGNESAARKLLDAGASPTVIGESTFKPIALAAKFGHAGLVKMFLDWKEKSSESEEEQEQEFERLRADVHFSLKEQFGQGIGRIRCRWQSTMVVRLFSMY
ncbi:uncharacterized protein N7529_004709 [Penicillium soppii]|uniref:uncharacterized protein n=1 Tax=Penicillium soppii TaxID=69789 RepID=UPI002549AE36|nr:uncharacterized protein N7529_004709 [Penicillium soppii]KAJ5872356.1 hypothetical protein N7529_004709 [Penicillium soppii]